MTNRVYIVDDDDAVRGSLHASLSMEMDIDPVAFASGDAFLERIDLLPPGVVVLDCQMTGASGMEVLTIVAKADARFAVIVLTAHGHVGLAVQSMKAGAFDFIEKPARPGDLLASIRGAIGQLDDRRMRHLVMEAARNRLAHLTARERDVLTELSRGSTNKVVAHALDLSPRTVEIHRANLLDKLGVRSLPEALRIAFESGALDACPDGASI